MRAGAFFTCFVLINTMSNHGKTHFQIKDIDFYYLRFMKPSIYSLIIQLIAGIILVVPFIGSGTLYDRRARWIRRLKPRGWLLIVLAMLTVILTYIRDEKVDAEDNAKASKAAKDLKEATNRSNKAINENTVRITTRAYAELIKAGTSQALAQRIMFQISQDSLKGELTKIRSTTVAPAQLSFSFRRDSLSFGSEKITIDVNVQGSSARDISLSIFVCTYYNGTLKPMIFKEPLQSESNLLPIGQKLTVGFTTTENYLNEMYVLKIIGSYKDYNLQSRPPIDLYYYYRSQPDIYGPILNRYKDGITKIIKNGKPEAIYLPSK